MSIMLNLPTVILWLMYPVCYLAGHYTAKNATGTAFNPRATLARFRRYPPCLLSRPSTTNTARVEQDKLHVVRILEALAGKLNLLPNKARQTRAAYRKLEKQIVAAQRRLRVLLDRTKKAD